MSVRVRIAPSPTGSLHIGTARTALFNFLFAKKNKGKFILRFEDTDTSRSTIDSEKEIEEGLGWLGLNWDEGPIENQKSKRCENRRFYKNQKYKGNFGPYRQMDRLDIYKKKTEKLIKEGVVYKKDDALWLDVKLVIDKYNIEYKPVKVYAKWQSDSKFKETKRGYFIKLPEKDLILGTISGGVEDFVIMRKTGIPTYHFAVVVDDEAMKITHVIRGQDHFSNTPKHFLLQKALGYKTPFYAHIPLTLNPDKTKLSSRFGATSISKYREKGYLPEALNNFMLLLGWHPGKGDEREIFSLDQMISEFSLKRMGKSAAIFDANKLNDLNGHYIRRRKVKELLKIIRSDEKLNQGLKKITDNYLEKILKIEQERITKLSNIKDFDFYFRQPKYKPDLLIFKKSDKQKTKKGLELTFKCLSEISPSKWPRTIDEFHKILKKVVQDSKLGFGDIFWPTRAALSGKEASPSPEELLWALDRNTSLKRISKAIDII